MFSIIVAFDKNQLIGKNHELPWHYHEDLQYFKEVTWGKKVVMGRITYEGIVKKLGKPLPNRTNIVISRKEVPNVEWYPSVEQVIAKYEDSEEEIFIIGGKTIYEQFLPVVTRLYITHINKEFSGDTYFPKFNYADFILLKERISGDLRFAVYERRGNK